MKREKGAVSVFLVIVLFTTVLLGGLFIDASRILLAKRFVRNAIDSSARSALSYYDAHLASEYGMFAVDGSTAEQAFRRYFKTHIKLKENERFDILRMNVEDGDIEVKTFLEIKAATGNFIALQYLEFVLMKKPCAYDVTGFDRYIDIFFSSKAIKMNAEFIRLKELAKRVIGK